VKLDAIKCGLSNDAFETLFSLGENTAFVHHSKNGARQNVGKNLYRDAAFIKEG